MTGFNKKSEPKKCAQVQKYILDTHDNGEILRFPSEIGNHMSSCQECQTFARHVKVIEDTVNLSASDNIRPYPDILHRLLAYINKNKSKGSSLIQKIESFMNYPIPVYQVLTGVLLLIALNIGLGMFSDSAEEIINSEESFYLADSTHKLSRSKGKTVYEDTVWARYMVTF